MTLPGPVLYWDLHYVPILKVVSFDLQWWSDLKRLLSTTRGLAAPLLCLYTSIAAVAVQQDMSPYLLAIFISQPMASFLNLSHLT